MQKFLVLLVVLVLFISGTACSSEEGSQRDRQDRAGSGHRVRNAPTQEATMQQNEAEAVSLGEVAEVDDISFRPFDVRMEDTAYYMAGPGASLHRSRTNRARSPGYSYPAAAWPDPAGVGFPSSISIPLGPQAGPLPAPNRLIVRRLPLRLPATVPRRAPAVRRRASCTPG
jgi:hypothetical protein